MPTIYRQPQPKAYEPDSHEGTPRRGGHNRNQPKNGKRDQDRLLPQWPPNYSVTYCYACGYPVADTLWITSDIQNERAAAAGIGRTMEDWTSACA